MTEVKAPIRVLESGKVYRQMFDAEVQLMKSFEATKVKTFSGSKKKNKLYLPELPLENSELNKTAHVTGSILTERQKTWVEGMPNDSITENPVVYRQLTIEAVLRCKESDRDIDASAVRGLPNIVQATKKDSDIVQRIAERRKQRHDKALEEMFYDLSMISNRIEPRITSIGDNLQKQLKEDDGAIETRFSVIMSDDDLVNFSNEQLQKLWEKIESHSGIRREWIKQANDWFNQVEDERLEAITGVLRKFNIILEKIASLASADIHRLIEKEAMMINQSILANRRAYAKLETNLLECDIEREINQRRTWVEKVKDWKKLNAEIAVSQFIEFMKSEPIVNPPEYNEAMKTLLAKQKQLCDTRLAILEQMRELKPPSSTKPSVYKWNSALTKSQEEIDKFHQKFLRTLNEKCEVVCQKCLSEIEKYKQNLLLSNVCTEEDMRRIVNEYFLPLVGNQLRVFEQKLEHMDIMMEQITVQTERQLKQLFKFAQGSAHLWDVHEIGMAKQERMLQHEMEQTRQVHDSDNQERESKLDVLLDRLRQESTDEALTSCLHLCIDMLSHIKEGYEEFHELQLEKVAAYPSMVEEEVKRYDESVCKFYHVYRNKPSDEPDVEQELEQEVQEAPETRTATTSSQLKLKKKGESHMSIKATESEVNMEKTFRGMLQTNQGTSFYIHTVADKDEFDDALSHDGKDTHSSSETKPESTFMTEVKGLPEDFDLENQPDCIKNIYLSPSFFKSLKSLVRMSFLDHLEQWKEKAFYDVEITVKNKREELGSELDLRLHLHAPRSKRIEVDVRNVRAAELVLHRERVNRHCRGIAAALASLKHHFSEITKQHDERANEFRVSVEKLETVYVNATKSSKLVELSKQLETNLNAYVEDVKTSLREFRQTLDGTLGRLRESNAMCVRSFKLFCEGGNFSPDETVPLRKKLEKMAQRVDAAEGTVMLDLEGMESRRLERATDVTNKFNDKYRQHLVDLIFIETMHRWMTNSQVKIKAEVSYSNGMAKEVAGHLSTLRRRVDACERPNFDKEEVSPGLLHTYMQDIMESLQKRAEYLNVNKLKLIEEQPSKSTLENQQGEQDGRSSPSTAEPTPPIAPKRSRRIPSPGKLNVKGGSRQNLETLATPTRLSRTVPEDTAIGLIKTILRAQKTKDSNDMDDARSTMTGTTRVLPSASNSVIGTAGRQQRGYQRQATLASIAGSEDGGKRQQSETSTYKRRETKFDPKYMIFGCNSPEGTYFMAKIHTILYDTLDGMLSTAEIYYKQKGVKASTRPQQIQDTFDHCADVVVEKLSKYDQQADDLHNQSLQDFRQLLRDFEYELCEVPRLVLNDILNHQLASLQQEQNGLDAKFLRMETKWENERKSHSVELRPNLGHPDQAVILDELYRKEKSRQENHAKGIEEHSAVVEDVIRKCSISFLQEINAIGSELLVKFDDLLTVDDVTVGRVPPKKEPTSVLMRRISAGYTIQEVADPSFGEKPIVARGPHKWPTPDYTQFDLVGKAPSVVTEAVDTISTTLPHTKIASEREDVVCKYRDAYVDALENLREKKAMRLLGESRWRANWEECVSNVKCLYH